MLKIVVGRLLSWLIDLKIMGFQVILLVLGYLGACRWLWHNQRHHLI